MAPPIITELPDRARLAAFPVSLIFHVEDPELRALINVDDREFGGDAPVLGHDEVFRFSIEAPVNEDELTLSLRRISLREKQCAFVVISDRLTDAAIKASSVLAAWPRQYASSFWPADISAGWSRSRLMRPAASATSTGSCSSRPTAKRFVRRSS